MAISCKLQAGNLNEKKLFFNVYYFLITTIYEVFLTKIKTQSWIPDMTQLYFETLDTVLWKTTTKFREKQKQHGNRPAPWDTYL